LADGEGFIRSLLSTTSLGAILKESEQQFIVAHRNKKEHRSYLETQVPQTKSFITVCLSMLYMVIWQLCVYGLTVCHDMYSLLLCILPILRKDLYYPGLQSPEKEMAWSENVSIKDIKLVRQAFGGTLNDVMLVVLTRCMKRYLENEAQRKDDYVCFFIPVSLRQPNDWRYLI
jgi:diacylglycerol O-acyltransferase